MTAKAQKKWTKIRKMTGLTLDVLGAECDPPLTKAAVSLWDVPPPKHLETVSRLTRAPVEMLIDESEEIAEGWLIEDSELFKDQINELLEEFNRLSPMARQRVINMVRKEKHL